MTKFLKTAAIAATALTATFAAPAMAQDAARIVPYVGASAGYHHLGDNPLENGAEGGFIYGGFAGIDIPLGTDGMTFGVEGNYHAGSGAIDSEYGIAGKLGVRSGANTTLFVKGGYQVVDFDVNELAGTPNLPGIDDLEDSEGDYLLGIGADIGTGANSAIRIGVDTIAFDTVRGTAGISFRF